MPGFRRLAKTLYCSWLNVCLAAPGYHRLCEQVTPTYVRKRQPPHFQGLYTTRCSISTRLGFAVQGRRDPFYFRLIDILDNGVRIGAVIGHAVLISAVFLGAVASHFIRLRFPPLSSIPRLTYLPHEVHLISRTFMSATLKPSGVSWIAREIVPGRGIKLVGEEIMPCQRLLFQRHAAPVA